MRHATLLAAALLVSASILSTRPSTTAEADEGLPRFRDVVSRVQGGIAHITTRLSSGAPVRSRDDAVGAGFVVRSDGLILTSRHVVSGAKEILVTLSGRAPLPAEVVGTDDATDLAILRVAARDLTPLPLGDPRTLAVGDWLLAAGSPYRLPLSFSVGIVSGLARSGVGVNPRGFESYIQTDAAANLGNSGGPLFDRHGRVVGMISAILSRTGGSAGISLAVPIDQVRASFERLMGGAVRPTLGLRVRPDPQGRGLVVTRFDPDSPAQAAGLAVGDLLIAADETLLRTSADLQRAVWARQLGERIRLRIGRGGRTAVIEVPLR